MCPEFPAPSTLAAGHGVEFAPLDDAFLALQDQVKGQGARAAITAARSVQPMLRRLLDDEATLTSMVLCIACGPVVSEIPMAALVALMVMVAFATFDRHSIAPKTLKRMPAGEITVMAITVIVVVATGNLAIGAVVGSITAMVVFAKRVAHLAEVTAVTDPGRPRTGTAVAAWPPPPTPTPIDPGLPSAGIRIGYARCSTFAQELDSQLDALSKHGIMEDRGVVPHADGGIVVPQPEVDLRAGSRHRATDAEQSCERQEYRKDAATDLPARPCQYPVVLGLELQLCRIHCASDSVVTTSPTPGEPCWQRSSRVAAAPLLPLV